MILTVWDYVAEHFSPKENWGDPIKINGQLLITLYTLRVYTDWPIIIHNAFETYGHSPNSQHYLGNASDWHFDIETITFHEQVEKVLTFVNNFQLRKAIGLGIYPAWNTPGFHLDVRGHYARWGWIGEYDKKGRKKYTGLPEALQYAKENNI